MILFGLAVLLAAVSGIPGLFLKEKGGSVSAALLVLGTVLGLIAAGRVLLGAAPPSLNLPSTPMGSQGLLCLDPVGAFFLIPVLLLPTCGSIFGIRYWGEHHENAVRLRLLYGITTAFLCLLVAASHALTFLLAWEGMAATAFFLVITEDRVPSTQQAGWLYLVATHSGTLCLFAAFALMAAGTGSFLLAPLPQGLAASGRGTAIFVLFLLGFGLKAGILPLHFWLPPAHAAAPSHVSAFMSGIFIKMGILGLVRVIVLTPDPPMWWGRLLVILGAISGILGVAFALGQHDLKRLLAYHSIENIGIILLGLGLGTLGKSTGHQAIAMLGFMGALLHVLNHSLFKGLLFLGAGSVVHATGTRELDVMGGLSRVMPKTAFAFLVGSWAICGLPPLNGFVSEWLIYLAAFHGLSFPRSIWSVIALGSLALIGTLAVACFAKVFGVVFLGQPRSQEAAQAHEAPRSMIAPMGILAAICILLGLFPIAITPVLSRVAQCVLGLSFSQGDTAHFGILTCIAFPLLILAWVLWRWTNRSSAAAADLPTWDCGYGIGSPRIQYTASSFAEGLVDGMRFLLWPKIHWRKLRALFPFRHRFSSHVPDLVLDRLAEPGLNLTAKGLMLLRVLQSGQLQIYLLYVLLTLFALLTWMVV